MYIFTIIWHLDRQQRLYHTKQRIINNKSVLKISNYSLYYYFSKLLWKLLCHWLNCALKKKNNNLFPLQTRKKNVFFIYNINKQLIIHKKNYKYYLIWIFFFFFHTHFNFIKQLILYSDVIYLNNLNCTINESV